MMRRALAQLASLKIAVVLLALSLLLVYLGTWAQVDLSIQRVEQNYFHAVIAWVPVAVLVNAFTGAGDGLSGTIPLPGGYLLGGLLLLNLLAAHVIKFTWHPKRIGIILVHFSVILLLVGEAVRSLAAVETRMSIQEGSSANYSYSLQRSELAVIDTSPRDHDAVTVIPASRLAEDGALVSDPRLPFDVAVVEWYPNSMPTGPNDTQAPRLATAGMGLSTGIRPLPQNPGTQAGAVDVPSAFVRLTRAGKDLGTYLVSAHATAPQPIDIDGRTYELALRFERHYKPYQLHLLDFSFDRYTGTSIPKNFSSRLRLVDPELHEDREVVVWMNHPLRHRGETFYQADWDRATEKGTVLQVVRNPGWMLPYVACLLGGLGLLVHFGISLVGFLRKRSTRAVRRAAQAKPAPAARDRSWSWRAPAVWVPATIVALALLYVGAHLRPPPSSGPLDLNAFAQLPVSYQGRVQPLDSVARNAMKVMAHRESFKLDGQRTEPIVWLIDLLAQNTIALDYRVLRIDHPDVLSVLNLEPERPGFTFAMSELQPRWDVFMKQHNHALDAPAESRTLYQRKILQLGQQLQVFQELSRTADLHLLPPSQPGEDWQPLAAAIDPATNTVRPNHKPFLDILRAYRSGQPAEFNQRVHAYAASLESRLPGPMHKVQFETLFNRFSPNVVAIALYVLVMILSACSWLGWTAPLRRAALGVLVLALSLHTLTLIARVYISGRPPVTNLANSAIFIGWGAALLALGIERVYRKGLATFVAGLVAFPTLLIAHMLSFDGDTLKVLQAVLDTNFWLATHVICITLGYSSMFLAGILAIVFVVGGFFTKAFDAATRKDIVRMIYGVTAFALLFSFVGTILGGIWADQSWGRFWGWDPKENGAALIVITTALFLHARYGGMVRERGQAALAIFGNIVTSWSWFGTNLLGVGLHSYGFMDGALYWLMLFVVSQLVLIGIAMTPKRMWKSYADEPSPTTPPTQVGLLPEQHPGPTG